MRPANKKSAQKSSKSLRPAPPKKKAAQKKTARSVKQKKSAVKSKSSETAALKKVITENKLLTAQLKEKKRALEIEAALESVRARTIAIHNSDELKEVVSVLFAQLDLLDMAKWGCSIMIFDEDSNRIENWMAESTGSNLPQCYYIEGQKHPVYKKLWKHWKRQGPTLILHHVDDVKRDFDNYWLNEPDFKTLPAAVRSSVLNEREVFLTYSSMRHGLLCAAGYKGLPEEKIAILERFAKVFEQTYTRFLDLQKAEAQAREAQIEAALERVRSRSLAMHKSEELSDVIKEISDQLQHLGFRFDNASFVLSSASEDYDFWFSIPGQRHPHHIHVPYLNNPINNRAREARSKGLKFFADVIDPALSRAWHQHMFDHNQMDFLTAEAKAIVMRGGFARSVAIMPNIMLVIGNYASKPYTENENGIIRRFAIVFEQSYTRFLDLQKAEGQAREAQIEAALERVRAKSMAMHTTAGLADVIEAVFNQFELLDIKIDSCFINIHKEDSDDWDIWISTGGRITYHLPFLPYLENPVFRQHLEAKKKGDTFYTSLVDRESKDQFFDHWFKHLRDVDVPKKRLDFIYKARGISASFTISRHATIVLSNYSCVPYTAEENLILQRIGNVFEQTYTRFLDLQKAEAQAREAQIEAALERVRAQTMAMHNSEDVGKCIVKMFGELTALGVYEGTRFGIGILNHDNENNQLWTASKDGEEVRMHIGILDMTSHPLLKSARKAWKAQVPLHKYVLEGDDLVDYYKMLNTAPDYEIQIALEILPKREFHYGFIFDHGFFYAFTPHEFKPDLIHIIQRFSSLFAQTYRRYLDLKKAEAQAREAQIEAALERVRSRSMGMQKSAELKELVNTLAIEIGKLDVVFNRTFICIFDTTTMASTWWMSNTESGESFGLFIKYHELLPYQEHIKAWRERKAAWYYLLEGEDKKEWDGFLFAETDLSMFPDAIKDSMQSKEQVYLSCSFSNFGYLALESLAPLSDDQFDILSRFAKTFDQSYTRFLDIQKAEAQAREAQIEAALERVRSRSMAMHKSDELIDTATLLYKELAGLGIQLFSTGFVLVDEDHGKQEVWLSGPGGVGYMDRFFLPLTGDSVLDERYRNWKSKEPVFHEKVEGERLRAHLKFVSTFFGTQEAEENAQQFPESMVFYCGYFPEGYLHILTEVILDAHQELIMKRFTQVFAMTYRRFLDLKKAESQAREAQIEMALERVRSRTMAMQQSDELSDASTVLFKQLKELGGNLWSSGFVLLDKDETEGAFWMSNPEGEIQSPLFIPNTDDPATRNMYAQWINGAEYYAEEAGGEALKAHYDYLLSLPKAGHVFRALLDAGIALPTWQQWHAVYFSRGYLLIISVEPLTEINLFKRFAAVFEQTYTRFLDLQKAETQARDATKRASVDRVRAEIASMRTTADLERITPLIWSELTTLGVPFIRCGVFIVDEAQQQIHTLLSTAEGKAIGSFNLPFDDMEPLSQLLPHWQRKEIYKDHWDEAAFVKSTKILLGRGSISSPETYTTDRPPTNLYLHFLPFLQGMLYVGSEVPLTEDELHLAQNLAEAFSTAYARYEDFNKLESANVKIEKTLVDLRQTQAQLVQSEKMASLGELTAGIAHEIQNPLNFVNNFSEVSNELIDELNEAMRSGNNEEVKAITDDVKKNLEKILHHGKRADAIVKGMLLHSRSSSGTKELTDINVLADEYLRLAYHGLRARDKSFNATMTTDFDETLEKVDIIPQDIGRVVLNLITNAFYAVTDKARANGESDYEPTVTVSTRKDGDQVLVSVKDNGNGIAQNVIDKIFQPFFTTKPTGQGTGLGLSLSYDIVKAHGGELSVETVTNEGSLFIIHLPTKNSE